MNEHGGAVHLRTHEDVLNSSFMHMFLQQRCHSTSSDHLREPIERRRKFGHHLVHSDGDMNLITACTLQHCITEAKLNEVPFDTSAGDVPLIRSDGNGTLYEV